MIKVVLGLSILAIFCLSNEEAQAYINPGSGSYILQVVAGIFLSIIYFIKKQINNLKTIFKKKNLNDE